MKSLFAPYDDREYQYRHHFFAKDVRTFNLFACIAVIIFPLILIADHKLWQTTAVFYWLLSLRLGIVALAVTAIIQVRRHPRPEVVDVWAFALATTIALTNNLVILSRPPAYLHHINLELIAIVVMYATLPDRLWVRLAPPAMMSVGSLMLLFLVKEPVGLVGGISIVLAYIIVNLLGWIISTSFYQYRRQSYFTGLEFARLSQHFQDSEQRYRQLIDNSHGIIYTVDPDGTLTYVSPSWTRLLGHATSDVAGRHFSSFVHVDDLPACTVFLEETIRSGEVASGLVYRVFHADGSLRWHRSNILPCFDENHILRSFVGTAIDITEIKQGEIELARAHAASERANQAKSEFLALIGHEIRTPMQAIVGFSTLIAQVSDPVKMQSYSSILQQSARSLLSLVDDILDVSRIEQGRLLLEPVAVNVQELLEELNQLFRMLAARKNISFRMEQVDNLPLWIEADPVRLRQIISNLITNAVKFTESGEVVCTFALQDCQPGSDRCLFSFTVRDTGIGIAPERQTDIFEPFLQQDASITRKFGGSGLGLSIVHRLIEMMGGAISLTSKVGVGTTFTVQLPLLAIEPPAVQPAKAFGPVLSDLLILVVEDSEANRAFLVEILTALGYRVKTAEDGFAAIELFALWPIDVIFMDIRLPDLDGIETTRRIRAKEQADTGKRVPIIALSADIDPRTHADGLAAGIDAFLSKPTSVDRILGTIARLTGTLSPVAPTPAADGEHGIDLLSTQTQRDLEYSTERCRGFLDILLCDVGRAVQQLQQAITADDRKAMAAHAHTLKGLCGHLSDAALRDRAIWLHINSPNAAPAELQESMRLLDAAYRRILSLAELQHG